mmetsp:Transcript_26695/g.52403  ORF Transcript_26695/g.52403 Transcript_26695/m.52403 type:complete len:245 (+) Transcript_26695:149-883(+)
MVPSCANVPATEVDGTKHRFVCGYPFPFPLSLSTRVNPAIVLKYPAVLLCLSAANAAAAAGSTRCIPWTGVITKEDCVPPVSTPASTPLAAAAAALAASWRDFFVIGRCTLFFFVSTLNREVPVPCPIIPNPSPVPPYSSSASIPNLSLLACFLNSLIPYFSFMRRCLFPPLLFSLRRGGAGRAFFRGAGGGSMFFPRLLKICSLSFFPSAPSVLCLNSSTLAARPHFPVTSLMALLRNSAGVP